MLRGKVKVKWWLWVLLGIGCVMIIGSIAYTISDEVRSSFKQLIDRPEFSEDEVVAIVKRVILSKESKYPETALVNFSGIYTGKGKWEGKGIITFFEIEKVIGWNFYEKSQTVEFLDSLPAVEWFALTKANRIKALRHEIISIVVEHAVRKLSSYGHYTPTGNWIDVHEVGQWTAVYEGSDGWRVEGWVAFNDGQRTNSYYSTWRYDYDTVRLTNLPLSSLTYLYSK